MPIRRDVDPWVTLAAQQPGISLIVLPHAAELKKKEGRS
jgi:hypothetical protein